MMRIGRRCSASLLSAVAAAVAITTAPNALADEPADQAPPDPPQQSCAQLGGTEYKCEAPGNIQLNDAPPVTNYFPLGDD
jgi:hypothetical protein